MKFRLLGPLEANNGTLKAALGPRLRIVLAMLLLNANRTVSTERLMEAVWGDAPPATARPQIQIVISMLRREISSPGQENIIRTRAPGYSIKISSEDLDLQQFENCVTTARALRRSGELNQASNLLRAGLNLWRGAPLADVQSPRLEASVTQLTESRLAALEDLFDIELDLGRHHQLVAEVAAAAIENPHRERLLAQRMITLFRTGRQAEALSVYRDARQALLTEYGLTPSDQLRAVEVAILRNDESVRAPSGVEHATPEPTTPTPLPQPFPTPPAKFIACEEQLRRLHNLLLEIPRTGSIGLVIVSGRAGTGKTSLALQAAHQLQDRFRDGRLYSDLGAKNASVSDVLGQFIMALAGPDLSLPDQQAHRAQLYRSLLAGRRVLVMLDGVEDEADALPLIPAGSGSAAILTSRRQLPRLAAARRLNLSMWDVDDGYALLASVVGPQRLAAEQEEARRLVHLCDGLPLALGVVGARLAARPHWSIARMVGRLLDSMDRLDELTYRGMTVREGLAREYEGISPTAQNLLYGLAALPMEEFRSSDAQQLFDMTESEATDVLASLAEVNMIEPVNTETAPGLFRMWNLVRLFVFERMTKAGDMLGAGRAAPWQHGTLGLPHHGLELAPRNAWTVGAP
ncbi:BTAD domain-containing putative transcriptional regulator [Kitasatospora misakiensis]|uniref:BTAD domain-containing putative transcriptional regulator n=1 Tax=Kitasatospora misakiensis TaxID=67330 RepID=A0ABW0X958_9ACTN